MKKGLLFFGIVLLLSSLVITIGLAAEQTWPQYPEANSQVKLFHWAANISEHYFTVITEKPDSVLAFEKGRDFPEGFELIPDMRREDSRATKSGEGAGFLLKSKSPFGDNVVFGLIIHIILDRGLYDKFEMDCGGWTAVPGKTPWFELFSDMVIPLGDPWQDYRDEEITRQAYNYNGQNLVLPAEIERLFPQAALKAEESRRLSLGTKAVKRERKLATTWGHLKKS